MNQQVKTSVKVCVNVGVNCARGNLCSPGGTPYSWMMGMIAVFYRSCNRRFSIFRGCSSEIY